MADADRDAMLRDMAANRGCRLVKSRRRTPGVGDYGRYGLRDAASGADVFGISGDGLTATPEEVEAFLRKGLVSDWKSSLDVAAPARPSRRSRGPERSEPEQAAPAARSRGRTNSPAPPPRNRPALRIVGREAEPLSPTPPPPPPAPAPARPILKIREARPADAAGLAALVGEDGVAGRLAALRKAGEPPLVADEGGVIVGCAAFHVVPLLQHAAPLGRITFLMVAPAARRRGIGRALVEEAEARLIETGCGRLEAPAEIELGAAPDFFRRLGWSRSAYLYDRAAEGGQSAD
ncbi:GNAT family N-acetyltransferase [Sphingomonas parva]|uniref:GNAT family N-acetyltransferase n=1 Tax=Sphingomonas parva TaxID=2555898 RepID=A0A4Y8ZT03_9SPHN|nr:GNAT family N-acetyltransferase [Sphingomonas parva]TFI59143.1 GNAT family N-acetyltransferase [Sphingomonas parva]